MRLVKSSGNYFVTSDSGREYQLCQLIGIENEEPYDIMVIMDFDEKNEVNRQIRVVDISFGVQEFIKNNHFALQYIENSINQYEETLFKDRFELITDCCPNWQYKEWITLKDRKNDTYQRLILRQEQWYSEELRQNYFENLENLKKDVKRLNDGELTIKNITSKCHQYSYGEE